MDLKIYFSVQYHKSENFIYIETPQDKVCDRDLINKINELWPNVKLSPGVSLSFRQRESGVEFQCRKPLLANGVASHHKLLKQGDRITLGPYRLIYSSFETVLPRPPVEQEVKVSAPPKKRKKSKPAVKKRFLKIKLPKLKRPEIKIRKVKFPKVNLSKIKHLEVKIRRVKFPKLNPPKIKCPGIKIRKVKFPKFYLPKLKRLNIIMPKLRLPALNFPKLRIPKLSPHIKRKIIQGAGTAAAFFLLLTLGFFALPKLLTRGLEKPVVSQSQEKLEENFSEESTVEISVVSSPPTAAAPVKPEVFEEPVMIGLLPAVPVVTDVPEKGEPILLVIPPGGRVPEFDLDLLFFHAHPDDESLDFGCLLALAEAAGLRTGVVTFTDGESGLDLYPRRRVGGEYPDHEMEGGELAAVRAGEVARAAEVLGVDLLIRLGLKNHPYNGKADELPPEEILRLWGGEEILSDTIRKILRLTTPETVAAPDKPGRAAEHFEHEAVGFLIAQIMSSIDKDAPSGPFRFITCIDPRQVSLYPDAAPLDAGLSIHDSTLRSIQLDALAMHETQNDAVNVGTGFLPDYPSEYFQIQFWLSDVAWDSWISSLYAP